MKSHTCCPLNLLSKTWLINWFGFTIRWYQPNGVRLYVINTCQNKNIRLPWTSCRSRCGDLNQICSEGLSSQLLLKTVELYSQMVKILCLCCIFIIIFDNLISRILVDNLCVLTDIRYWLFFFNFKLTDIVIITKKFHSDQTLFYDCHQSLRRWFVVRTNKSAITTCWSSKCCW